MAINTSSGPDKRVVRSDDTVLSEGLMVRQAEAIQLVCPSTEEVPAPISSEISLSTPGNIACTSQGDYTVQAHAITETVSGYMPGKDLAPTPMLTGKKVTISNGSMFVDIGNPLSGGLGPATNSGYKLVAHTGDIELSTSMTGSVFLRSGGAPGTGCVPYGIVLHAPQVLIGCPPMAYPPTPGVGIPPIAIQAAPGAVGGHAVLAEQLLVFLSQLCTLYDTHMHPATSQFAPTLIPVAPSASALLAANAPLFTSKSVVIGF